MQSLRTERSVPQPPPINRALPVEGLKRRLVPTKVGGHRNSAGGVEWKLEGHAKESDGKPLDGRDGRD